MLETLPCAIQELTLKHLEGLQEIRLIYDYPVAVNQLGKMKKRDEVRVEKRDVQHVRDKMGYHGNDMQHAETCSPCSVEMTLTLHGKVLRGVVQNPAFHPLVGNVQLGERRCQNDTVFKMALELNGKGQWLLYPNLQNAVDSILLDKEPEGLNLGSWMKIPEPP